MISIEFISSFRKHLSRIYLAQQTAREADMARREADTAKRKADEAKRKADTTKREEDRVARARQEQERHDNCHDRAFDRKVGQQHGLAALCFRRQAG